MNCSSASDDLVESSQHQTEVIQPIGRDTVHRICSGQVVLSLAIAVKELVENAIDAGATIIDIQLREYGSELIEISDNGVGVEKENFKALTLKHYTSKIKQFEDLTTLSTLGFRGEALSSLCALSDLTILTKHKNAEHATKITYDRNGKIVSETLSAREQGTTVTLTNLFSTLPVRRKEFLKNLKREFNKMCQLLYAYCLVSKGIKFSCTNTTNKGSKNAVVATEGLKSVKENIINVFGAKQTSTLIEVEISKPEEPILGEYGIQLVEGECLPFSFDLFISSVVHGSGRSTTDRQFFYINSRPCEPTKVIKLINEVYKQYNNSQYPFVYLNVLSKSCLVDVNVTPDKRQIFLEKEKVLLATVKQSLVDAFKNFPSTFKMQNLELTQNTSIKDFFESSKKSSKSLKRSLTDSGVTKGSILERFKKRSKTEELQSQQNTFSIDEKEDNFDESTYLLEKFVEKASEMCKKEQSLSVPIEENEENSGETKVKIPENQKESRIESVKEVKIICRSEINSPEKIAVVGTDEITHKRSKTDVSEKPTTETKTDTHKILSDFKKEIKEIENPNIEATTEQVSERKKQLTDVIFDKQNALKNLPDSFLEDNVEIALDTTVRNPSTSKSVTLNVTLDDIKNAIKKKQNKESCDVTVRFRSKINPESNKSAEEELRKQISKEDFTKMSIIGQFNLGFIIAKLENDLFIIDQHATDEKYNFEQLQANTVMENQVLVNPKPLNLTAANESLLIENEETFRKNGFTFKIDESAPCTKKVLLTSVPLSKSVVFGKDDIDEMLFMLQDSSDIMCRPTRIRAMFASRACRKSVMIGKSLSKKDMTKLVQHMGEIEQPWNCPHGRPTMRHLVNLDLIDRQDK